MTHAETEVNQQGRVTIPARLRAELDMGPGAKVVAYAEDGRLVLEDPAHLLARLQDQVARAAGERGSAGSVVDELLAERRVEAGREDAGAP